MAERLARAGVAVPARELDFVRQLMQEIEAVLAIRYREDGDLAVARAAVVRASAHVQRARTDEARVAHDTGERIQGAARASGVGPEQLALRKDGFRAVVARDAAGARTRAAETALAEAEQALDTVGLAAVDRLHTVALDGRPPIDAFVLLLNERLAYHGHPPVEPFDELLTDELVQRGVRATRLLPPAVGPADGLPPATDPTPEGAPR